MTPSPSEQPEPGPGPGPEAGEETQPVDLPDTQETQLGQPTQVVRAQPQDGLRLLYSAISDVGRVRKDNQDSGYAGPWLLSVCDGVGGAARGDIASSTAISELRLLDAAPPGDDRPPLLDRVTDALHAAHERIGDLVDEDPSIDGTSTTATVALFDGRRVGIGHVGDSRAYLFRDGEISQLTTDHTFVQSLIDEGRITPAEARVHPHRNLILKALDGMHEADPDLFVLEVVPGDRLFLCSDGACGVLDDGRLADVLSMGSPDYAAVELVRASLEAGSSDNVTCIVADVVTVEQAEADPAYATLEPLLVGAASELRRRNSRVPGPRTLFRGHRSGDTGELEPIDADILEEVPFAVATDPIDPETARYAPRPPERFVWLRRLLVLVVVVGVLWVVASVAWSWSQKQYYLGEKDGTVVIFRGVDAHLPGIDTSTVVVTSDLRLDELNDFDRSSISNGVAADGLEDAEKKLSDLGDRRVPATDTGTGTDTGSPTGTPTLSPTTSPTSS